MAVCTPSTAPANRGRQGRDAAILLRGHGLHGLRYSRRPGQPVDTFGLENSLATPFWSAVKTGTSKDMRDNWCIGFTDRFTVGVWVGNFSGASMHDVSGITGAAPVWLEVMNYLDQRFGGGAIARPAGVTARMVEFPGTVEPSRKEWFIAGTEPNREAAHLDDTPRILSPAPDTVIAFDPDIPVDRQRVAFVASAGAADGARWTLDRKTLGPVNGVMLWAPSPEFTLWRWRTRRATPSTLRPSRSAAKPKRIEARRIKYDSGRVSRLRPPLFSALALIALRLLGRRSILVLKDS